MPGVSRLKIHLSRCLRFPAFNQPLIGFECLSEVDSTQSYSGGIWYALRTLKLYPMHVWSSLLSAIVTLHISVIDCHGYFSLYVL